MSSNGDFYVEMLGDIQNTLNCVSKENALKHQQMARKHMDKDVGQKFFYPSRERDKG